MNTDENRSRSQCRDKDKGRYRSDWFQLYVGIGINL